MVKLAACVEMIFSSLPFLERLDKVRETGLSAFEFWDWRNKDIDAVNAKRRELGLLVTSFVVSPQISLTKPDVTEEFVRAVKASIRVAEKLECGNLIGPVGLGMAQRGVSWSKQFRNAVKHLKAVAPILQRSSINLLIEPVNLIDHRDCFLSTSAEGYKLIREANSPNVRLLFDFYHQQITEGNLTNNVTKNFNLIGFFHIGDVPGRHEPGTGEINYRNIFRCLDALGYKGHCSLEFVPTCDHFQAVHKTIELAAEI